MNYHVCTSRLSSYDFFLKRSVYLSSVHIRHLMVFPVGDICATESCLLVWQYDLDAINIDVRLLIQRDGCQPSCRPLVIACQQSVTWGRPIHPHHRQAYFHGYCVWRTAPRQYPLFDMARHNSVMLSCASPSFCGLRNRWLYRKWILILRGQNRDKQGGAT